MNWFFNLLVVFGTFAFMEGVAWFTHKYIMHGFLWTWHESHHVHHKNILEKNDLFAVCFSAVAIVLIVVGFEVPELSILKYFGFGVTLYGLAYFVFHDVIVHRRVKLKINTSNRYLQRIMRAHYIHHKIHEREGAEAFGFLFAPKKYDKPVK
jgi:beta-carotene 3-hydroxylase